MYFWHFEVNGEGHVHLYALDTLGIKQLYTMMISYDSHLDDKSNIKCLILSNKKGSHLITAFHYHKDLNLMGLDPLLQSA